MALILRTLSSLTEIPPETWDRLAQEASPFCEWGFLSSLEEAECTDGSCGWLPQHVILEDDEGLIAALPTYIKGHSMGEFVFDHEWSYAAARVGIAYYPKGIVAAPFTPVTGHRMLIDPARRDKALELTLAKASWQVSCELELSGLHWLFTTPDEGRVLEDAGFAQRLGIQYHWHNHGYGSFEDWLSTFKSKRRRNMRRERKKLREAGITVDVYEGDALTPEIMALAYDYYLSTIDKKAWGRQYLNQRFYELLAERLPHRVMVMIAREHGEPVGGALFLHKDGKLYGRYWGAREDIEFLHFEVCYYKPVELCIERGWSLFEAGAQGFQKYERGFAPVITCSSHRIQDPRLDGGIRHYLEQECAAIRSEHERLAASSPSSVVRER